DQVKKMCAAGLFESPNDLPCDSILTQGAVRITTTIDLGLQEIGERVVEENIAATEDRYGGHNGSLVAIRPATGEILTYVGSRDYDRDDIQGKVDIAVSLQSHGSTMKPFTYLTAFEQGWVPSTLVQDEPLFLNTAQGKKQVNNWNFSHLGTITVRKALSESVNTAAVRTLQEVGGNNMRDMAHRLGITDLQTGDCGATITLGACETKQLDMVFAYSVFANNGVMKGRPTSEQLPDGYRELDPVSVLKIEDARGNVLYQFSTPEERQVVDPAYAYMITDILSKNAITWSRLTLDRPAASKTGTSEDFRDGVLLGFTPDLAAGVWMGNADNTAMAPGTFSSAGSGPMWRQFMLEAHSYLQLPPKEFTVPDSIVTGKCGEKTEIFKEGREPTKPSCKPGEDPDASPTPTPKPPVFPTRIITTPTPTPTPSPAPDTGAPLESPITFFYTVKIGDTMESIAQKFGVSVSAILGFNDLDIGHQLHAGDVLKIPIPVFD
ncbi:MAG: penicillin-binding transpeptidase domain-containing protein, partial [Dehalococcoidia bacterium]